MMPLHYMRSCGVKSCKGAAPITISARASWREAHAALRAQMSSAAIAQLGERQTEDLKVPGSIPGLGIFVSPANMLHFCLSKERRLVKCISRESSPGHIDGNDVFYH